MPQVAIRANAGVPTQADKRRSMVLKDDHQRPWFAVIEKSSGYPTGLVQPLFEVASPELVPPQKYLLFPADEPGRIRVDYASWEADQLAREQDWDRERLRIINIVPGGAGNPIVAQELGPRPMSWKVVRAMKQGNRWALGFTTVKPPEAEDYFPTPKVSPDAAIFTETAPVFTEEAPEVAQGQSLASLLAEIKAQCPSNLRGAARSAWLARKLEELAVPEGEEAKRG